MCLNTNNIDINGSKVHVQYTESSIAYWSKNDEHVNVKEKELVNEIKSLHKDFPEFTFTTEYKMFGIK